jgi:catechol 2,3-dioxygenase-like lactoylglutathione lyase family enzyme
MRPSNTHSSGLPGLRGTDHIGFTVPDLEQATRFFVNVIGCKLVHVLGPISDSGDWMQSHLNVHPRATVREIRLFRCRQGSNFEIFEYTAPEQRRDQPRNSDVGGHHLAFYVDDMAAALAHLIDQGIEILGEPTTRADGPSAGKTWVYFLAPWGMQLELVSYPQGQAYEEGAAVKLWHPADPAN